MLATNSCPLVMTMPRDHPGKSILAKRKIGWKATSFAFEINTFCHISCTLWIINPQETQEALMQLTDILEKQK